MVLIGITIGALLMVAAGIALALIRPETISVLRPVVALNLCCLLIGQPEFGVAGPTWLFHQSADLDKLRKKFK